MPLYELRQNNLLRYRGTRGAGHARVRTARSLRVIQAHNRTDSQSKGQHLGVFNFRPKRSQLQRRRILIRLGRNNCHGGLVERNGQLLPMQVPALYVLNVNRLTKPHAIQQLRADIESINPDIIVVIESWLSADHLDSMFCIPGYCMYIVQA